MERMALTIPEAAEVAGVSVKTMWRRVWRREIPSVKFGDSPNSPRRILVKDLNEWMEECKEG